ncbi:MULTISPECIES: dephospho-CoA kinase [Sphingobium]|uniref:Dephospho-CoA kinase n=1 Tax=Sphingobium cupriresistens LL01 TaxID=1420583 RepID=A0A0J7XR30_9SPHN|nr:MULTISPECIES: dephospho-CoA kinase [Sphingobium]KMS54094.1 dephospho-CoA kinase [Sphingobium cupriresistens LL01]MBJ7377732.1 dephospho-CoA kinase [Sphingobium sp.]WCP13600.1 Dephospho-CoA kinase [Sphingobium sp. AntQ-1]
MKVYGLTGSIGMGKSAVAAMLRREGVPVFDADAQVHILQGPGGALLPAIEARFPGTTGPRGVDRAKLGAAVFGHPQERRALEAIVHPAVQAARRLFLRRHRSRKFVVLDIPLLFETHGHRRLDGVIVVTAPAWKQRKRVLARPGMTATKFRQIVHLQTPDAQKRRRADHIIRTGATFTDTRAQVRRLVACLGAQTGR